MDHNNNDVGLVVETIRECVKAHVKAIEAVREETDRLTSLLDKLAISTKTEVNQAVRQDGPDACPVVSTEVDDGDDGKGAYRSWIDRNAASIRQDIEACPAEMARKDTVLRRLPPLVTAVTRVAKETAAAAIYVPRYAWHMFEPLIAASDAKGIANKVEELKPTRTVYKMAANSGGMINVMTSNVYTVPQP